MNQIYLTNIADNISNSVEMFHDKKLLNCMLDAASLCAESIKYDCKIMFIGNGGSAADAQHLAAELVVKLKKVRDGLPGLALTTDTSVLTAIANDFGYDDVFARQVETFGRMGDVLIAISTSGSSNNIVKALVRAKELGISTILLTGPNKQTLGDINISVPGQNTGRIQEGHILLGHTLIEMIETQLEREDFV